MNDSDNPQGYTDDPKETCDHEWEEAIHYEVTQNPWSITAKFKGKRCSKCEVFVIEHPIIGARTITE